MEATTQASTTCETRRLLRVISPQDWRGFLSWNCASGNIEPVFDALVHDPDAGKDVTVCIKLYPGEDGKNRGMVNEITGWLLSHVLRLPQPGQAYLVKVPVKELSAPLPAWIRGLKKQKVSHYWAFATAKLPAESAAIQFHRSDLPLLVEDLKNWEFLPHAIALDEHIANTDRHLNNLLRLGKANYALIDNGRLAVEDGERNWQTSYLNANRHYTNLLSSHCWKDNPPRGNAATVIHAGDKHADALGNVRNELVDWWRRLIPDLVERQAFDHFITSRANSLSNLLSHRYRQLPL